MKHVIIGFDLTDGMVLIVQEFQKYLNDSYRFEAGIKEHFSFYDALYMAFTDNLYSKLIHSMESWGAFDLVHGLTGDNDEY